MRKIIDTFSCQVSQFEILELGIDREVPEVEDVLKAMPPRVAKRAIALMSCPEEEVRRHLKMGSTPPTLIPLSPPFKMRVIKSAINRLFHESYICI